MSSTRVQGQAAMKIGYTYRLVVPSTSFLDLAGNAVSNLGTFTSDNYKVVSELSDCQDPVFLTASMGDAAMTGSPRIQEPYLVRDHTCVDASTLRRVDASIR